MIVFETSYDKITATLGGKKNIGTTLRSVFDAADLVKRGLKKNSIYPVLDFFGIEQEQLAAWLNVDEASFSAFADDEFLDPNVSERVLKLAELMYRGKEVFGRDDYFKDWMNAKIPALSGRKPVELLDTFSGMEYVLTVLGRIEHGVYS